MYSSTCACVLVFKYDFNIYLIRDEDKNNSAQYEVKIAVELKSCFLYTSLNSHTILFQHDTTVDNISNKV